MLNEQATIEEIRTNWRTLDQLENRSKELYLKIGISLLELQKFMAQHLPQGARRFDQWVGNQIGRSADAVRVCMSRARNAEARQSANEITKLRRQTETRLAQITRHLLNDIGPNKKPLTGAERLRALKSAYSLLERDDQRTFLNWAQQFEISAVAA